MMGRRRERLTFVEGPDRKIEVKQDNAGAQAYITVGEWCPANLRLMSALLESGELLRGDMEYYLAYTVSVYEKLDVYE